MDENKQEQLDISGWDDFSGEYLKTDLIKEWPVTLVPVKIEGTSEDGVVKLTMITEYNKRTWKLNLNKTNQNFIRGQGIPSPKALVGKKVTFEKIKVRNPQTNAQVDSFSICKIE